MSLAASEPTTVVFCHCGDCKRWTGAPAPAFAAFHADSFAMPTGTREFRPSDAVTRWTCARCGSPIAATFAYLPGQIYVPLGVLDQADRLGPSLHCHAESQVPWLHQADGLRRVTGTGRDQLNGAS